MEFYIVIMIVIIMTAVVTLIDVSEKRAKIKAVFKSIGSIEEIHLPIS